MTMLLLASVVTLFGMCLAGNNTITEECWFQVEVKNLDGPGQHYTGEFTIGVFGDAAPMTVLNFVSLVKGYKQSKGKKSKLTYKDTKIHRIVPDFVLQMGDVTTGDGTGGTSIYGDSFNDEEFTLSHQARGIVAMANHGADTNGSQFYILLNRARWLDGKHVVFGKVIMGFDVLKVLGEVPSDPNTAVPKNAVTITACGIRELAKPYDLTEEQMKSEEDL